MATNDLRAWTSFDTQSQLVMRAGGTVTGGDGRQFTLINGHATVVGSPTYQAGIAARTAVTTPAAPAPAVSPPPAVASPAPDKGGWMTPSTGAGVVSVPTQPGDPDAATKDAANRNALALIRATLAQYGLPDTLADWAWSEIVAGKGSAEILLDLRQRPEFKAEFPEIDARQKAGLAPLNPGDIVSYRQQRRQMMQAAGLPAGFYDDKSDAYADLVADRSLKELSDRIADASDIAFNWPAEDKQALYDMGFAHGDLTAMALNADIAQPLIHKRLSAAKLSGSAIRSGFGALTADEGLRYTEMGVTPQQAEQDFANLTRQSELFNPLDAGETAISRTDQLGAALGGNAAAQQRIMDRARRRQATFAGGGGFAGSQAGLAGYGNSGQ